MNAEPKTLVPASNFEVRSLRGVEVHYLGGYFCMDGFGIWDKTAQAWVNMSKPRLVRGQQVYLPYSLERKHVVQEAVSQGLYAGYRLVRPETPVA